MRMVFQMAIEFLSYSANMFQPFVEPHFVFCFLNSLWRRI